MEERLSNAIREVQSALSRLSPVPAAELARFIESETILAQYPIGTYFTRPSDASARLGFVVKGLFRVFYVGPDGSEHVRNFCRKGTFIGAYGAILSGQVANVAIQSLEAAEVLELSYPALARQFETGAEWERLGRRIAEEHYISRERREHALLTLDAFGRLQRFQQEFADIAPFLKRSDIASYIDVRPETLSRLGHRRPSRTQP